MIIRPSTLDPFFLNLDTLFQRGYMGAATTYQQWSQTVPSSSKATVHGWLDKLPKMREWLGPREVQNLVAQAFSLENKKFELTYAVDRTDIDDDNMGLYGPATEMMGLQAAEWPDDQMTTLLEAAGSATTFDGTTFYSTSHPVDTANPDVVADQANLLTSTALSAPNVSAMRAAMRNLKGRDGKPFGVNLTDIMVPPALESTALQIANAEFIVATFGTNASTGGQTNVLKGSFNVIVNPKLTSATTWYGFCNRFPVKAFIWQLRQAPEFTYLVSPSDPGAFNEDKFYYGCRARGCAGLGLWFLSMKATA